MSWDDELRERERVFDRLAAARLGDDSPTCPHAVKNADLEYDEDLGLWVHGRADCRRPEAGHLRNVTRVDGGFDW